MTWTVTLHRKAEKQLAGLPKGVLDIFKFFMKELEIRGPKRGD
ncbi:MAG: type II toxin-antitoxin system RelE family toxin [Syntrophales bacterium]